MPKFILTQSTLTQEIKNYSIQINYIQSNGSETKSYKVMCSLGLIMEYCSAPFRVEIYGSIEIR